MLIYLAMIEGPEERSKFEQIYEKYRALMFYRARQILGDDRDAEDAVHEAFVRVANHIEKISDPECPKTRALVVIIVERISINEYNRKKRRGRLPLAEELLPGEDRMEALEEGSAVARAIAALPPRYRELILLKHWQGYSDREIAALLGMAQGNVARTLQRAKEKLRKALKDEGVEV